MGYSFSPEYLNKNLIFLFQAGFSKTIEENSGIDLLRFWEYLCDFFFPRQYTLKLAKNNFGQNP